MQLEETDQLHDLVMAQKNGELVMVVALIKNTPLPLVNLKADDDLLAFEEINFSSITTQITPQAVDA